jgi:flagellar protein FliJ
MKTRNSALAMLRFVAEDKGRLVSSLEAILLDFEARVVDLTREIAAEEDRTGVNNPASVGYSTLAWATALRRARLMISIQAIKLRLKVARREHRDAIAELERNPPWESR